LRLVYYESELDKYPKPREFAWADLRGILEGERRYTPCAPCVGKECPCKPGPAFSPVVIPKGTRANDNVGSVTALVLDLDGLSEDQSVHVFHSLREYEFIVYPTHSHRYPDFNCFRVILPLSREFTVPEGKDLLSAWQGFLKTVITFFQLPADPACKDLARLYYLPSISEEFAGALEVEQNHGLTLDVDAFLSLKPSPVLSVEDRQAEEEGSELQAVGYSSPSLEGLSLETAYDCLKRARLKHGRSKREGSEKRYQILDRIIDGKALAKPSERSNTINQAASLVAFALPFQSPVDLALELLRPSVSAMGSDLEPEGLKHWLGVAKNSYQRSMRRREKADQERRELIKAIWDRIRGEVPKSTDSDTGDWTALMLKDAKGEGPKSCGYNIEVVLKNKPEVKGTIRFNEVTKGIDVFGGPFAEEPKQTLHVGISNWFQKEIGIAAPSYEVKDQIARIARINRYDPLADYLNSLHYNGKDRRLDTVLEDYFGAPTEDAWGNDITQYLRMIGPRWFIATVGRALKPGSKMDYVLNLEGDQGLGKSTLFNNLAGEWFTDSPIKPGDKDSMMKLGRYWIIELAEFVILKLSDPDVFKGFVTSKVDSLRPPYGAIVEDFPRRCVTVGTMNPPEDFRGYLVDETGNRRIWPVYVENPDATAILQDRDKLWAEAVYRYKQGERHWISKEEFALVAAQTEARMVRPEYTDAISQWWLGMAPKQRPTQVSTYEVALYALQKNPGDITEKLKDSIGKALKALGFAKTDRRGSGPGRPRLYLPSNDLAEAPKTTRGGALRVVAGTTPNSSSK
jgi:predicted P-loop ATPase